MDRDQLFASLAQAPPSAEDVIYVERRGREYAWHQVENGVSTARSSEGADVWMYFTGVWPREDPVRARAFCDDMIDEMESMAGGADRCRWPLDDALRSGGVMSIDDPWPQLH